MTGLVLITGNRGKAEEYERLLGISVTPEKIALPEVQALSVEDVVSAKAMAAYAAVQAPVIVDDSGISFSAWSGLPGALTSWFMDTVGNDGLVQMLVGFSDRSASVKTAIGYCDEQGVKVFVGTVDGRVATEPRGTNGFGYDPIFIPDGAVRTFAEMSAVEKDLHSMRKRACDALREGIEGIA